MKIGILKENKVPVDHRVPFTPEQCKELKEKYSDLEIIIEPSDVRCFKDQEYVEKGITLNEDLSDCDIIFGVKEVPKENLIFNKKHLFFSHTIKKQPYNQTLLQEIIEKKIQLIDYETLKLENGNRVVAFGRWAGIVGAYNALLTYGKKHDTYHLKPAHDCFDLKEVKLELRSVKLPAVKILLTGTGRVSKGAMEILTAVGIKEITPDDFTHKEFNEPVYAVIDSHDYNEHKNGEVFKFKDFYANPTDYKGTFERIIPDTDILIAGAYWDPNAPVLFTDEDVQKGAFKMDVIADITCDIKGSIPTTIRPSTIADPCYDINRETLEEEMAYSKKKNTTVMAVDNLPCELSRDASESFGRQLIDNVVENLFRTDNGLIARASITSFDGNLTNNFEYLRDYLEGKT